MVRKALTLFAALLSNDEARLASSAWRSAAARSRADVVLSLLVDASLLELDEAELAVAASRVSAEEGGVP